MVARESSIERAIMRHLSQIPGAHFIKLTGVIGAPDRIGCINGRMICIEIKRPGERPRPSQEIEIARWQAAGAVCIIAHSWEEVAATLASLDLFPPAPMAIMANT